MELIHSFNEYAKARLGVNFNTLFEVSNWDEDVIHARHEDYEVFKYIPVIRQMKDLLIELFKIKDITMELTWAQINKLYNAIHGRDADEGAKGFEGQTLDFFLNEVLKSEETQRYARVKKVIKDQIENWK